MRRDNRIIFGLAALAATAFAIVIFPGPFYSASTCDKCGKTREMIEWQVPLMPLTIARSSNESDTALSRVLRDNDIVKEHEHRWVFEGGAGNGIFCAIGRGRYARRVAESEDFAAIVLLLHQQDRSEFRDRILNDALDWRYYDTYHEVLSNPPDPAMSDSELDAWIGEMGERLDKMFATAS